MDQLTRVDVRVQGTEVETVGRLDVARWDKPARLRRAFKFFSVSLAATLAAVFIPGLHFILVPVGLITTLIGPAVVYSRTSKIAGGSAVCPYCSKDFPIAARPERYPFDDICTNCQRHVTVSTH